MLKGTNYDNSVINEHNILSIKYENIMNERPMSSYDIMIQNIEFCMKTFIGNHTDITIRNDSDLCNTIRINNFKNIETSFSYRIGFNIKIIDKGEKGVLIKNITYNLIKDGRKSKRVYVGCQPTIQNRINRINR